MSFRAFHEAFSWVMVVSNGLAGAWGTAAHWSAALRRRELWWLTAVAQVSVAVQVLLGVLVLQVDGLEAEELHVVYGFVALASVGILYSYRQQLMAWQYLLYGLGGLFLMGLGIREMVLA